MNFPLQQVFEKYGLVLFKNSDSASPIQSLDDIQTADSFKQFLFEETNYSPDVISDEDYLKESACTYLLEWSYCKIAHFDKWIQAFKVDENSLPIPKEFLLREKFIFSTSGGPYYNLVMANSTASEFAFSLSMKTEDIYKMFLPSYEFTKVFLPDEVHLYADREIQKKVKKMDSAPNDQCVKQFKSDLFDAIISTLNINKEALLHSVSSGDSIDIE